MAVREVRSDDFDANITEDVQQVRFSVQGTAYVIDLGPENRREFDLALEPFVEAGRLDTAGAPVPRNGKRSNLAGVHPTREANDNVLAIRRWAQQNGFVVGDRGRIPAEVRAAYTAAVG